nr:hypothetical protein HCOI_00463400 [Haemonchus contortus]
MEKGDVTSAVGMAGVIVRLLGCASLAFEISSLTYDHPVFFTDSACIPGVADAYNITLGNDLLRKLPLWTTDYATRTFPMANQQVQISYTSLAYNDQTDDHSVAVRVAETTVLPPSAETFVRCSTGLIDKAPLMLISQSEKLAEKSIMVTPAVVRSANPLLLVANPSPTAETLYEGQHISAAVLLCCAV